MVVGVGKIKLHLPDNHSLKGKRQVLRAAIGRVRSKWDVAIAEVDDQDLWQVATLGVSCVSNDTQYTNEVLSKVLHFLETLGPQLQYEVIEQSTEFIHL